MDITWHGSTCFKLKSKGVTLIINPDKDAGKLKGEVVLSSLKEGPAEVAESMKIIDWPGEYEIKEIPIVGFPAWTKSKSKEEQDEEEGKGKGDKTIIFYFEINKIKVCHLGDLGHTLTSETVKEIGDVDILMINLGKDSNLNSKKTMEIVESIDPRMILPMGTESPEERLKELGSDPVEHKTNSL